MRDQSGWNKNRTQKLLRRFQNEHFWADRRSGRSEPSAKEEKRRKQCYTAQRIRYEYQLEYQVRKIVIHEGETAGNCGAHIA